MTVEAAPAYVCEVVCEFWVFVVFAWAPYCELLEFVAALPLGLVLEVLFEYELFGVVLEDDGVIDGFVEELKELLALPFAVAEPFIEPDMPELGVVALLGVDDCMLLLLDPNWLLDCEAPDAGCDVVAPVLPLVPDVPEVWACSPRTAAINTDVPQAINL